MGDAQDELPETVALKVIRDAVNCFENGFPSSARRVLEAALERPSAPMPSKDPHCNDCPNLAAMASPA